MAVLKASRLKAVLDKARNAGQVEETATIAGVQLVFRSLNSQTYNDIVAELDEVPDKSYAMCYQVEHVSRSLVEIDQQDLRDVDYIEVEAVGTGSPVKVERHQWVKDTIVSTWSREMVMISFRKVLDAIAGADAKAAEGVQFRIEAETDEEKYRRIMAEAKEVAADVPEEIRTAILREHGLLESSSRQELDDLDARARTWAVAETAPEEPATPAPPVAPPRAPIQIVQAATPDVADDATEPSPSPDELMARRTPMNRTAIQEPMPQAQADSVPSVANRRSPLPPADQVHTISARYASIEGMGAEANLEPSHMPGQSPYDADTPVVLEERRVPIDKDLAKTILDKPPTSGVNTKFSPRAGGGLNPRSRG